MMQILREVTEWSCDYQVCNHTYLIDSNKVYAYAIDGGSQIVKMSEPLVIDKRYRKFIKTEHKGLAKLMSKALPSNVRVFNVKSKNKVYTVEVTDNSTYRCGCTGFTFRGKCKHGDAVIQKLSA